MKRPLFVLVQVSAAFVLCVGMSVACPAQQFQAGKGPIRFLKDPEPIPELTLKTVDGKTVTSSDWQDKVILLNFWATWCPPCLDEIPELIKLQSKYAGHLQIIGLSLDSGPPNSVNPFLKSFIQQRGINYPVAVASSELRATFGEILALPTAFLSDQRRRIVQKHVGIVDPQLYEAEVRALLGLSVAAKIERFEDTGQVFLAGAKRTKQLLGVDFSRLAPEQKESALRLLNERMCSCSCRLTLAQCRINDSLCRTSSMQAAQVVAKISAESGGQQPRPDQ